MRQRKVLHIRRDLSNRPFLRQMWGELRRLFFFYDQEGYFDASLYDAFPDVTSSTANRAYNHAEFYAREVDLVVVNSKTDHLPGAGKEETLRTLGSTFVDTPTVLVEISANAACMPDNTVCDAYDLIFRREHFSDTGRYNLSDENQEKLRSTMLPCLFVPLPRYDLSSLVEWCFIPQAPSDLHSEDKEHDVFFCGQYGSNMPIRSKVVRTLKEATEIDFYGGLQSKSDDVELPEELTFPRLNPAEYVRAMKSSRIVLALDGIGQFTFRHLEAWYFEEFLMSSPSIRELTLPLSAEEGTHYVAFDDETDLVERVMFYLEHKDERERIARAGSKMFEEQYNPKQHGQYIARQINEMI